MAVWMIRGGRNGEYEQIALDNSLACIGWYEVSDLSACSTSDQIRSAVAQTYSDASAGTIRNFTGQLVRFVHRMNAGDIIVMPLKNGPYMAVGKIEGPYQYRTDLGVVHHVRKAKWISTDTPRTKFGQDLLYSLGSMMTVCQIQRNNAEERIKMILKGHSDPGLQAEVAEEEPDADGSIDIEQVASDGILEHLRTNFKGHELAWLVDHILRAEGYVTELSPPGPDGGVDILAGLGALGFGHPRLCVQVKSSENPVDVTVLRALQGSMATFKAEQGLLVSWGGFNTAVQRESRMSFFSVRLWDAEDLRDAIFRNYDRLPEGLRKQLPLRRVWALVQEGDES